MRTLTAAASVVLLAGLSSHIPAADQNSSKDNTNKDNAVKLIPQVQTYVDERAAEFDQIPDERKEALDKLAAQVRANLDAGQPARLTFICTHNSRRSHLAQIWGAVAAESYKVPRIETFSGGTEATAFNPRAIAALERAGLKIKKPDETKNPHYQVRYREAGDPLVCFSKDYSDEPNPSKEFIAVLTCSQADESCPTVRGASHRVSLPYDDPKVADGTAGEAAKYDERSRQICREMLYLFAKIAK